MSDMCYAHVLKAWREDLIYSRVAGVVEEVPYKAVSATVRIRLEVRQETRVELKAPIFNSLRCHVHIPSHRILQDHTHHVSISFATSRPWLTLLKVHISAKDGRRALVQRMEGARRRR